MISAFGVEHSEISKAAWPEAFGQAKATKNAADKLAHVTRLKAGHLTAKKGATHTKFGVRSGSGANYNSNGFR